MRLIILSIFFLFCLNFNFAANYKIEKNRPDNFVNVAKIIPQMQFDMRYYGEHNFVGRRINGYEAPVCLLTKEAVSALQIVESKLLTMNLTLKAYDCYRPQTAVNDFANWATQLNNTKMKAEFYPTVDKANLFKEGYIAYHSGHSRGSTLDLTIVPLGSKIPQYDKGIKLVSCTSSQHDRFPDNSLDFGDGFDCFSPISHPTYLNLSPQILANRLLLKTLMEQARFIIDREYWHFTLIHEPYPDTAFDFPVK